MNTSSRTFRRAAIAGACAAAVGASSLVIMNMVSATNVDDHATDVESSSADCTIDSLPFPDDTVATYATAISSDGRYIAGNAIVEDFSGGLAEKPTVWLDDDLSESLVNLPDGESAINAINRNGKAIATVEIADGDYTIQHAYSWVDEEVVDLAPDAPSRGLGINDQGVMVGSAISPETDTFQAIVFSEGGNEWLDVPEGTHSSQAVDVDEDGTVVGSITTGSDTVPYVWDADGVGEELTVRQTDFDLGSAISINGGWIIAEATAPNGDDGMAYWHPNMDIGYTLYFSSVTSVNAVGQITGDFQGSAAFMFDEETNTLPSPNEDPDFTDIAVGSSENGTVFAGTVNDSDGDVDTREAAIWNCSPQFP